MDYKEAAEVWRADQHQNPDGWYADPEAMLAVEEGMYEYQQQGMDPLEFARIVWRHAAAKFRASKGVQVWYAGTMVAVEKVAEEWQKRATA